MRRSDKLCKKKNDTTRSSQQPLSGRGYWTWGDERHILSRIVARPQTALRYDYLTGYPTPCSVSHSDLANHWGRADGAPELVLAHRLASALVEYQTASGGLAKTLRALSDDLAAFAPDPPPVPASFAELVGIGEQVEGARFAEWVARLPIARAATGDEALRRVLELARAAAADSGLSGNIFHTG